MTDSDAEWRIPELEFDPKDQMLAHLRQHDRRAAEVRMAIEEGPARYQRDPRFHAKVLIVAKAIDERVTTEAFNLAIEIVVKLEAAEDWVDPGRVSLFNVDGTPRTVDEIRTQAARIAADVKAMPWPQE